MCPKFHVDPMLSTSSATHLSKDSTTSLALTSKCCLSLPGPRVLLCHFHVVVATTPAILLPLFAILLAKDPAWQCTYPNILLSDIAARSPVYKGVSVLFWSLHLFSALAVLALTFPEVGKVRPRGARGQRPVRREAKAKKKPEESQGNDECPETPAGAALSRRLLGEGVNHRSSKGSTASGHGRKESMSFLFGSPPRSFKPCLNFILSSLVWGSAVGLFGLIGFMYDYDVQAIVERERGAAGGALSHAQRLALLVHRLHVSFALWFFLWTFVQVLTWWWGVERHLRRLATETRERANEENNARRSGDGNGRSGREEDALLAVLARDTHTREICAIAAMLSIAGAIVCAILSRSVAGYFVWGVLAGESGTLISGGCLVGRGLMGVCERVDRQEEMEILRLEKEG